MTAATLLSSLFVFVLASFVGFEVINKVPPTLHTPLMSGANAISGIAVIGALIISGPKESSITVFLGLIAIVLAMVNVVGGFLVTDRMLQMFKKKEVKA
jgi:NAD(P) transhydrogenase subunit alpha